MPALCRSIKTLRRPGAAVTGGEVRAAALQYVRKVSGHRVPSRAGPLAFDACVDGIAESSRRLLDTLVTEAGTARS